jgi:hypothetical protein
MKNLTKVFLILFLTTSYEDDNIESNTCDQSMEFVGMSGLRSNAFGHTTTVDFPLAIPRFVNSDDAGIASEHVCRVGRGVTCTFANSYTISKNEDTLFSGTVRQLSDKRLKRNIRPLSHSLLKLKFLKPVNYQWNSVKRTDTVEVQTGFIAQDVEVLFPELVTAGTDGYKSINYLGLIPHLVEAIKELKIENEQLKIENSQLKKSIAKKDKALDTRMRSLEMAVQRTSVQTTEKQNKKNQSSDLNCLQLLRESSQLRIARSWN